MAQSSSDFANSKEEKLKSIFDFTLAITIEYKLGLLNSTNLGYIEIIDTNTFSMFDIKNFKNTTVEKEEHEKKELPYAEVFKKKYFERRKYYFYKSILSYITGFKAFQITELKSELDLFFPRKNGEVPIQEKLLDDLGYQECIKLNDKDYRILTKQMLNYVDSGSFQLKDYVTIFHFATRFNNLLNFDLGKLKNRFFRGIKKGRNNYTYIMDLGYYLSVSQDQEFKEDLMEIVQASLEMNESLKEVKAKSESQNLLTLFLTDFERFINIVDEYESEYRFIPFWLDLDIEKVLKRIEQMDKAHFWRLGLYFKRRYKKFIFEKLLPEKKFVVELREFLDRTLENKKKNLKQASMTYLRNCLIECEDNFLQ